LPKHSPRDIKARLEGKRDLKITVTGVKLSAMRSRGAADSKERNWGKISGVEELIKKI